MQSRYPSLHFHRVRPESVQHLYDMDDFASSPALRAGSVRVKKTSGIAGGALSANETSNPEDKSGSPTEANKENIPKTPDSKEVYIHVHVCMYMYMCMYTQHHYVRVHHTCYCDCFVRPEQSLHQVGSR